VRKKYAASGQDTHDRRLKYWGRERRGGPIGPVKKDTKNNRERKEHEKGEDHGGGSNLASGEKDG